MRRKLAVGLGVVLVIVALLVWWKSGGGDDPAGSNGGAAPTTSAKTAEGTRATSIKDRKKLAPAKISGRVTRKADGSGVPGAVVSLAAGELLPKFISAQDTPTRIAVTDATGAWKLDAVIPGTYSLGATAKGLLPGELQDKLVVGAGEDRRGVDLALVAGGTLVSGTVTDVGGGPIADARLTAVVSGIREIRAGADFITTTGADGRYEITLPTGELKLVASHDDYSSGSRHIELSAEPMTVDFSLVPGATIRGTVVARDSGQPVSGGVVRAEGDGRGLGEGDAMSTIDEEGNFVLRGLTSGQIELHALGLGFATESPTVVSIGIGEQLEDVKVLVDRAYSISGRVVRKGKPEQGLPGVTLGAFSIASQAFGFSLEPSAADGAFTIVGLKKASYNLFAVGEGSVPDVGKPVEIVDRDLENVIVELDAGVTISGRVEPATPKVAMSIEPAIPIGFANMFEAVKSLLVNGETDDTGAFVLRNVPAGSFKLNARAEDGRAATQPLVVADVDQSGIVVKLEPRASISGRVVDTNGKPVPELAVQGSLQGDTKQLNFNINGRRGGVSTKADGTFSLVGLDPGEYEVQAQDGDPFFVRGGKATESNEKSRARVKVAAGEAKTGVVLTVEARDGVIRGTVLAPDGKPAADAWVTASRTFDGKLPDGVPAKYARYMNDASKPVLTNADGQFTITRLRKGTFTVAADGPRGASHVEKTGVKPGDTITLQLTSLGSLTGKVTVGGAPVTKFDIGCEGGDGTKRKHVEAADGVYTLERLAPGAYDCEVDSDAGTAEAKAVVGSEPKQLDISLTRWATVTGVVVDVLTKRPVAGVIVMANAEGRGDVQAFSNILAGKAPTSDPSGRFTVERVPPGKGFVSLMPKDGFTPLGHREYTASEGQRIDLGTIEIVAPRTGDAGTFGFSTAVDGDKLLVASVTAGPPAEAAGVKEGDRILSIDGRDVATMTPGIAKLLLQSGTVGVGQTVALGLDRAGTPVQVSLTSVKW
ncbi:MAG TPA: carboxypeptidase regulatory-like domain-containing protein [Kofleriaceae bacterium]|nr:carboxypeptidase regulatory-like domain-containing protein [Kofleriaceae bacterium]